MNNHQSQSVEVMGMKTKLKILMVDDHPFIIEGYKNTLEENFEAVYEFDIDVATNCDEASHFIMKNASKEPYDLAMVDISLPPSSDGQLTSGEDVVLLIKEHDEDTKVIILTMHTQNNRIHNILSMVNPDGFLIKSDLTSSELVRAFEDVLAGRTYFSHTVNDHFRKVLSNDFSLDQKNLQILYHLGRGVQTKNLGEYINLSLSAIEKRKNHIKELFGLKSSNDQALIEEARNRGFI